MKDLSAIKGRQREMWAAGDYAAVATPLLIVSELLCEAADLRAGSKVLDVATGSGNTALAAARRRCHVTAIDYVPSLLGRARERAAVERLEVRFEESDKLVREIDWVLAGGTLSEAYQTNKQREKIEEEARLVYVGLSRAKKALYASAHLSEITRYQRPRNVEPAEAFVFLDALLNPVDASDERAPEVVALG